MSVKFMGCDTKVGYGDSQRLLSNDSFSISGRVNNDNSVNLSTVVNDREKNQNILVYFEPGSDAVMITDIDARDNKKSIVIYKTGGEWRADEVAYVDGQQKNTPIRDISSVGTVQKDGTFVVHAAGNYIDTENARISIPADFSRVNVFNTDTHEGKSMIGSDKVSSTTIQPGQLITEVPVVLKDLTPTGDRPLKFVGSTSMGDHHGDVEAHIYISKDQWGESYISAKGETPGTNGHRLRDGKLILQKKNANGEWEEIPASRGNDSDVRTPKYNRSAWSERLRVEPGEYRAVYTVQPGVNYSHPPIVAETQTVVIK